MEIKRINIIGFGNVGQALYKQVVGSLEVVNVYTRSISNYESALYDFEFVDNIDRIALDVDLNLIAIPDSGINKIVKNIDKRTPIIHTSGGVNKDVLKDFSYYGIIYPLQTFTKGVPVNFETIPVFIEASSPKFESVLSAFVQQNISNKIHFADSLARKHIHLSAVITSNFLTYFLGVAENILNEKEIPLTVLQPLIEETLRKALDSGPQKSLTGPASRGDTELLLHYDNWLTDSDFKKIFKLINDKISKKEFTAL